MNLLLIIEELELGGAEQVVINLARSLDRTRFQVKVCCLRAKGEFASLLEEAGIEVIALNKRRGLDLLIIPKIIRVIKKNKIDIVHTHLWVANFWGRIAGIFAGVPVVITEHNVDFWKSWSYRWADRFLSLFTKKICAVSGQVKKFYVQQIGIDPEKVSVVYNGIDPDAYPSSDQRIGELRTELDLRGSLPVIANIGRLVENKAQHVFLEALKILDQKGIEFRGLIVGDGPLKSYLVSRVSYLGIADKVMFTGLRKDVLDILDVVDVSVLSSKIEGLSVVILESMAKGVPVVATNVGGNGELVSDGETGFLVSPNNPAALADAIVKVIEDPGLQGRMGRAARERIRGQFSLSRMAKTMERIYTDG